ncbi:TrkH family potassium uptake protein [Sediminitomix flava]|uniref:Trk-type K+ transport system membrane component n=1 Tax=Sediminitomix flava TaxID=379075 RepID=A0A315ZAI7_SEDFL|nr:potassium transporter TrkG [Sediminitomix flava]PWJ42360.1 Trk-type K+ transport system membrane component [Sediminitomix flava]
MSWKEKIDSVLFGWRDIAFKFLSWVVTLNVILGFYLLIYRYGFLPTDDEIFLIFKQFDGVFAVFVFNYLIRLVFTSYRREYIKNTKWEGILITLLFIHGSINSIFEVKGLYLLADLINPSGSLRTYQHFLSIVLVLLINTEVAKWSTKLSKLSIKPATTFILSFVLLILLGALLLMMPAVNHTEKSLNFIDALFTSTSASCVTGLAVVDTGMFFNLKGQLIILFLAQVGGIGIITFATFFATFLTQGVGLKQQLMIQDMLSGEDLGSVRQLLTRVVLLTLSIEALGTIAIFFSWGEDLIFNSFAQKVFYSIFHGISAFCNAGFSLFPDSLNTSMLSDATVNFKVPGMHIDIRNMYGLHFVVAIIIVLGSVGFSTIGEIFSVNKIKRKIMKPWKAYRLSTSISLKVTGFLLLLGTVAVLVLEFDKMENLTFTEALITSFFQSVTTRTAGFNSMDFGSMHTSTLIIMMLLMFIGASPGSTGGGIKTTTIYIIAISVYSNITGQDRITKGRRTIPNEISLKAVSIFLFASMYNLIAIFLLSVTEESNPDISLLELMFEQTSAFSTAGLSMGITSSVSTLGKLVLILSMYLGRVGTLTLALALSTPSKSNKYLYPEEAVMVG